MLLDFFVKSAVPFILFFDSDNILETNGGISSVTMAVTIKVQIIPPQHEVKQYSWILYKDYHYHSKLKQ